MLLEVHAGDAHGAVRLAQVVLVPLQHLLQHAPHAYHTAGEDCDLQQDKPQSPRGSGPRDRPSMHECLCAVLAAAVFGPACARPRGPGPHKHGGEAGAARLGEAAALGADAGARARGAVDASVEAALIQAVPEPPGVLRRRLGVALRQLGAVHVKEGDPCTAAHAWLWYRR